MKPERIQDRLLESPDWAVLPATLERSWPCRDFLEAARLARVAESVLAGHAVSKEVVITETGVTVRLVAEGPVATDPLFEARDEVETAVSHRGGSTC